MPSTILNRLLWFVMLGVLGIVLYYSDVGAYLGKGRLTVATDPADERTVILRWRGAIEPPMRARIEDAFKEHRHQAATFVLSLSSPGGSVSHGAAVVRVLRDIRRTHRLETVLEGANTCASMCVPIYLQGEVRRATGRSRWMFHEVSLRDPFTDEKSEMRPSDRNARTDKLFDDFFRPAGVPESWMAQMRTLIKSGDVWRSGDELLGERAGIVLDRL